MSYPIKDLQLTAAQLEEFGQIQQLEMLQGRFFIKIGPGFKNSISNVCRLTALLIATLPSEQTYIHEMTVDNDSFELILGPQRKTSIDQP